MPRSRTISGIICLAAICAPLVIAPFRIDQSLAFVREIENRAPNEFPEFTSSSNLIDKDWWSFVSRGFEDRVPYRQELISLNQTLLPASSDVVSDKVSAGVGDWLFWRKSLAQDFGTLEDTSRAISAMDAFINEYAYKADFYILAAPDKATIYPEKLTEGSYSLYEPSLDQRALLHDWFALPDSTHRFDIWGALHQRKSEIDEPLYEPGGQHHNSKGAMVMAKTMIDVVDPTLWNNDELVDLWTKTVMPELAKRGGDWDRLETYTHSQIHRPGVNLVELWDNDKQIKDPDFLSIRKIHDHRIKHAVNESQTHRLIPGKTLILHDSFIENYLLPSLSQFFVDVTFIHIDDMTPEAFHEALDSYDLVFMQSVERYFVGRALKFFEDPAP